MLDDGSFEIEGYGRQSKPVNEAVISFAPAIRRWAKTYGVPSHIVAGVMMRESQGVQRIVSPDGGYGLMQLTSQPLKEGHSNEELLSNPDLNIQLGTKFLGRLWQQFAGNPIHAITAYNAGSVRCGGSNPWNLVNTGDYVGGVLRLANGAIDSGAFSEKTMLAGIGSLSVLVIAIGIAAGWLAYDYVGEQ